MTASQLVTLAVLAAVVAALIWDKLRADVVALTGAAILLITGVVRPVEVQGAFASPAIIALASLFVIAYAMELSGLLDAAIRQITRLCRRIGKAGLWVMIALSGSASAFLNNTPIVVLVSGEGGSGGALGIAVGDAILLTLARRLTRVLKPQDTLARFGGDQFLANLVGLSIVRELGRWLDRDVEREQRCAALLATRR